MRKKIPWNRFNEDAVVDLDKIEAGLFCSDNLPALNTLAVTVYEECGSHVPRDGGLVLFPYLSKHLLPHLYHRHVI